MIVKRLSLFALVAAMALSAGGCGGDDESEAERWASDVCTNLSEWITDVDDAVRSLTAGGLNFSKDDISEAVDAASTATDQLVGDLKELGPPDTDQGQEAQDELEQLSDEVEKQVDTVKQAVDEDSGPLELAGTVSTALGVAINELQQAFENLQELDPGGELQDAFDSSEDCDSLRDQVEEITS